MQRSRELMFYLKAPANTVRSRMVWSDAKHAGVVALTMCGLILSGQVRADGTPEPAPSSSVPSSSVPSSSVLSSPATPALTPQQRPALAIDPRSVMIGMAEHLEKDPNYVVLKLEALNITQGDVAGGIRAMPPSMGSLGYQEVYSRALDIMTRQKAMVLRARREHLDKDPAVLHQIDIASERVLAEAWLTRRADAAVTDEALHARYDRYIAGKPGPEQVKARVILVATEAEAQTLIQQVHDGADFGELAHQHSKDPTAAAGGELGYVTREALSPEVGSAMFALAPGEVTAYPVPSLAGYFIIRVEGRWTLPTPTFDEARVKLEQGLRSDAIKETVDSLLSNIKFFQAGQSSVGATPSKP
jgi:peptidyl-prolyl cis-trans isomerase C